MAAQGVRWGGPVGWGEPVGVARDAEQIGRADGEALVPEGGEVQPVVGPGAPVLEDAAGRHGGREHAVVLGEVAIHAVELATSRLEDQADRQHGADVRDRHDEHPRAALGAGRDDIDEGLQQRLAVEPGAEQIVHPRGEGDDVRLHRQRRLELGVADLRGAVSADGEVGVADRPVMAGEDLGEPVRSPAGRAVGLRVVADPFGEAVPDRDIAKGASRPLVGGPGIGRHACESSPGGGVGCPPSPRVTERVHGPLASSRV